MVRSITMGGAAMVWWDRAVPRECDVCGARLSAVFVDCKVLNGMWCTLCVDCAGELAVASSPPLCRVYQLSPLGWVSLF
jgi:hypothetical protein